MIEEPGSNSGSPEKKNINIIRLDLFNIMKNERISDFGMCSFCIYSIRRIKEFLIGERRCWTDLLHNLDLFKRPNDQHGKKASERPPFTPGCTQKRCNSTQFWSHATDSFTIEKSKSIGFENFAYNRTPKVLRQDAAVSQDLP